ncbi:MAG: acyloxyacyl hydrolase [Gammaproteobacteria bacterium]|nr:acyloxyacyl hydrolase [Gammaproteobacteria bacterium]
MTKREPLLPLLLLAFTYAPTASLAADSKVNDNLLSVHAGQEDSTRLNYVGVTFGRYAEQWPNSVPMLKVGRKFFAQDRAKIGIEFTIGRFDKSTTLPSSEIDLSIIPKARFNFAKHFFVAGGLGIGYNELRNKDSANIRLRLGSDLFFAYDVNLGYEFKLGDQRAFVEYLFTHRSNANLASENQSLNVHLISTGILF